EHHERQAAVTFQRMPVVIVEDGLLFPVLQPPVARRLAVVLVDLAVAIFPLVELAGGELQPAEQTFGRKFGACLPVLHVVDHLVARVVGNPTSVQSSPLAFFARTFSSMSSEMT